MSDHIVLKQVKSCGSVSCLINTEPLELLRLQPSEPIDSESAPVDRTAIYGWQASLTCSATDITEQSKVIRHISPDNRNRSLGKC